MPVVVTSISPAGRSQGAGETTMTTTGPTTPRRGRWARALGAAAALAAVAVTTCRSGQRSHQHRNDCSRVHAAKRHRDSTSPGKLRRLYGRCRHPGPGQRHHTQGQDIVLQTQRSWLVGLSAPRLDVDWRRGSYIDDKNYDSTNTATVINRSGQLVSTSHLYSMVAGKVTRNSWRVERTWGSGRTLRT